MIDGQLFRKVMANSPGGILADSSQGQPPIFISAGLQDNIFPIQQAGNAVRPPPLLRVAGHIQRGPLAGQDMYCHSDLWSLSKQPHHNGEGVQLIGEYVNACGCCSCIRRSGSHGSSHTGCCLYEFTFRPCSL